MTSESARQTLERRYGKKQQLENQIEVSKEKIEEYKKTVVDLEKAQSIIQTVAQLTQEELEYHISEIATLALESVFENPYKLNLDFELRRNKSEADLSFSRKGSGDKIHPLSACGGGAVDVAAFALRIAMWSLQRNKSRNTLILDEPFKNINDPTREMHKKASLMIKEISDRLNLQIIIVTLMPELIDTADKVIEVKNKKGVSEIS